MLYRILTEDKPNLASLASRYLDGFTILYGTGYWRGVAEDSAIIEVDTVDEHKVLALASDIREYNHQEAVLVQRIESTNVLIEAKRKSVLDQLPITLNTQNRK